MPELLQRESDGFARTPSGYAAVLPKRSSGVTPEGNKFFEFKTSAFSQIVRCEWPKEAPIAVFDSNIAAALVKFGWAALLSDADIEAYNKLVNEQGPDEPKASSAPATISPDVFPPAGWLPHPQAPGYFYKDQEVLTEQQLRERGAAKP